MEIMTGYSKPNCGPSSLNQRWVNRLIEAAHASRTWISIRIRMKRVDWHQLTLAGHYKWLMRVVETDLFPEDISRPDNTNN